MQSHWQSPHSIGRALSSTPPVVCTATSHAITEVCHFSLDSCEDLPACHHVCTSYSDKETCDSRRRTHDQSDAMCKIIHLHGW